MKTNSHKRVFSLSLLLIGSSLTLNAQTVNVPGGTVGSSGNNNVGINVSTPNATLDVGGTTTTGAFKITTTNVLGMGAPGQEPVYTTPYALRVDFNETVYQPTGLSTTALLMPNGQFFLGNISSYNPTQFLNLPYQGLGMYKSSADYITLTFGSSAGLNWKSTNQTGANKNFKFTYDNTTIMQLYPEGRIDITNTGTQNADLILKLQTGAGDVFRVSNTGSVYIGEGLNGAYFDDYRLYVEKGIRAERVRVDIAANNGWADYVFEDDYTLMPLAELVAFIKQHKHLPNVPSAKEVAEEGIDLAEMNAVLLRQIEELTLRLIKMQAEIEELQSENQ